jgi:CO/xanthine dehydrogenase FAD-binding subunit
VRAIKKYSAPRTLDEAARILAAGSATPLAGGTDLLPRWTNGLTDAGPTIVDLKRIVELKGVSRMDGEIRVGACTPLSDIASDPVIGSAAPVLAEAADRVACPQIRNRATIGGNLCNASPAADTAIPLILLDAVVELVSQGPDGTARREMPIADFFRGPGATARASGEILTCIRFKPLPDLQRPGGLKSAARLEVFTAWDKFGTRRAMEIAVASVGVALMFDGGTVVRARVGCGSVAPIPLRGRRAEAQLTGSPLSDEVIERCTAVAQDEIAPITDVRASAAYRREVVGVMLRRMLERARGERQS